MYLAAILDSSRKGGNFLSFLNNFSKQSVSTVVMSDVRPPWHPWKPPKRRIKDFNSDNSYLPSLTCYMDVRVHIGRSTGRSTPQYWHLVAKNDDFIYPRSAGRCTPHYRHLVAQFGRSTLDLLADVPPGYWHLVAKNGNFRFLLSQLI